MCTSDTGAPQGRLWRNGMDFEPKKTYPPDYSNVSSVRDWQMSPFSKERFDLNEIQIAEKLGVKGKAEAERLKRMYMSGGGKDEEKPSSGKCPECAAREKAKRLKESQKLESCTDTYLYQPYGPAVVSTIYYSRPESNRPRMYNILGPSRYSIFGSIETPCEDYSFEAPKRSFKNVYIPYGPFGEIRFTPDMYVPMGPTIHSIKL